MKYLHIILITILAMLLYFVLMPKACSVEKPQTSPISNYA